MKFIIALSTAVVLGGAAVAQQTEKPNILVIWGDDVGYDNISA